MATLTEITKSAIARLVGIAPAVKQTTAVSDDVIALDHTNLLELVNALNEARTASKLFKAQEDAVRAQILTLLDGHEAGSVGGFVQVMACSRTRTGIDTTRLKAEYPAIAEMLATATDYIVVKPM